MMKVEVHKMRRVLCLAVAVLGLSGTIVFAQGVVTDIKTPPLQNSDTFNLKLDIHPAADSPPYAGWAGARMKMHVLDADEMDVDAIVPVAGSSTGGPTGPPYIEPFGPRSENRASEPRFFTAWHPLAQESGINVQQSVNQPVFDVEVHVKGSDPSGNSDVDATFMFWNIWHLRPGNWDSLVITLEPSDYIWVSSQIDDINQLHTVDSNFVFPQEPATINNPNAKWIHVLDTARFHLTGPTVPGSQFWATFLNTATLGIEHVPEPASGVLLAGGMAFGFVGLWLRRRRRAA